MQNILRTIRAVLWSFLGLRDNAEGRKDSETVNLFAVISVAFVAVVLFVLGLMFLVNIIV